MATTVKLDPEAKRRLEKLQAMITVKSGKKLTQQELLDLLIKDGLQRSDEFAEEASGPGLPMADSRYEKLLSLASDWGVETSWEDIDEVLYGKKERE